MLGTPGARPRLRSCSPPGQPQAVAAAEWRDTGRCEGYLMSEAAAAGSCASVWLCAVPGQACVRPGRVLRLEGCRPRVCEHVLVERHVQQRLRGGTRGTGVLGPGSAQARLRHTPGTERTARGAQESRRGLGTCAREQRLAHRAGAAKAGGPVEHSSAALTMACSAEAGQAVL